MQVGDSNLARLPAPSKHNLTIMIGSGSFFPTTGDGNNLRGVRTTIADPVGTGARWTLEWQNWVAPEMKYFGASATLCDSRQPDQWLTFT